MPAPDASCPCSSGRNFAQCCAPYLSGGVLPLTAETLMRSRYSAYATGNVDYLRETLLPGTREDFDRDAALKWAESSEWTGLDIRWTEAGGPSDETGAVEFVARFTRDGQASLHHETSRFEKRDGRWYFVDGISGSRPRIAPKVGRNDPCICGSGKKYKKCCAAAA